MAGLHSQALLPRRGILAVLMSIVQVCVLSAGLVVPVNIVSAISANTGTRAASEDHHEQGISICGQKRSRNQSYLVARQPLSIARDSAARRSCIASAAQTQLHTPDGHRLANGLLAPLTC